MTRKRLVLFLSFSLISLKVYAQDYGVLPKNLAKTALSQCSRLTPSYEGAWNPSPEQIKELEENLSKLDLGKTKTHYSQNKAKDKPQDYQRQYVGILLNGEKVIYINAALHWEKKLLSQQVIQACDGGTSFWGAVYNPKTKEFSHLAFNGVA